MRGGRGHYYQRYDRYDNRGRGRGYVQRYSPRGPRRPFYPRPFYDRRRYHDSRDRDRDYSRSPSYEEEDPMKKVGSNYSTLRERSIVSEG